MQGGGGFWLWEEGPASWTPTPVHSGSRSFQAIELHVELLIVPLHGAELVVVQAGKGVDEVGAQIGVHIAGQEARDPRSVLGPVGEVADQFHGRAWPVGTEKISGGQKGCRARGCWDGPVGAEGTVPGAVTQAGSLAGGGEGDLAKQFRTLQNVT